LYLKERERRRRSGHEGAGAGEGGEDRGRRAPNDERRGRSRWLRGKKSEREYSRIGVLSSS